MMICWSSGGNAIFCLEIVFRSLSLGSQLPNRTRDSSLGLTNHHVQVLSLDPLIMYCWWSPITMRVMLYELVITYHHESDVVRAGDHLSPWEWCCTSWWSPVTMRVMLYELVITCHHESDVVWAGDHLSPWEWCCMSWWSPVTMRVMLYELVITYLEVGVSPWLCCLLLNTLLCVFITPTECISTSYIVCVISTSIHWHFIWHVTPLHVCSTCNVEINVPDLVCLHYSATTTSLHVAYDTNTCVTNLVCSIPTQQH